MASIVLLGTLDTKGTEYGYLRDRLSSLGHEIIVIDAGVLGEPAIIPDIARAQVARAAGHDIGQLASKRDRGEAISAMADGARAVVLELFRQHKLQAIAGLGGSGGTAVLANAMHALPVGVPKLVVSTVASGDTRSYVGAKDICMMHSVVDIAGLNRISKRILDNAAGGIAGMADSYAREGSTPNERPMVAATMFGVTTPCVTAAKAYLEARGYEVLVFHAVGTGGQAMEALIAGGFISGVLDVTTTELADQLVGGIFAAGRDRLTAAGHMGVPQVVSVGALDMVNFGARETVPESFSNRNLYAHNASITLMRTTPEESALLGTEIAEKLSTSRGPVAVFIPLKAISAIAARGGVFHDPAADASLFAAIRAKLGPNVELHELDLEINDTAFAEAMAERLVDMMAANVGRGGMS